MSELNSQTDTYLAKVETHYADASLVVHRTGLEHFLSFTEERGLESVAEVTEAVLRGFHSWLVLSALSPVTVDMRMRSVKLFLAWACCEGLVLYSAEDYKLERPESVSPEPPTVEVMKRLLELPDQRTPEGLRDQLALELLYGLGLRRAEACRLEVGHLSLHEETLFVTGKGGHQRLLPVGLHLKSVAERYLFNARNDLLPRLNETAFLLDNEGQPLRVNQLYYIVKKYGGLLDLKLSTHHLRHACATHLTEAGMEFEQVQQLLGHQRLSSTVRYAQISQSEMEREFHRVHPRSNSPCGCSRVVGTTP